MLLYTGPMFGRVYGARRPDFKTVSFGVVVPLYFVCMYKCLPVCVCVEPNIIIIHNNETKKNHDITLMHSKLA